MKVKELIECLECCQDDAEIFVAPPDRRKNDYVLERVRIESDGYNEGTRIFLDTSSQ